MVQSKEKTNTNTSATPTPFLSEVAKLRVCKDRRGPMEKAALDLALLLVRAALEVQPVLL